MKSLKNLESISRDIKINWTNYSQKICKIRFLGDRKLAQKGKPETAFLVEERCIPVAKVRYCYNSNKRGNYFLQLKMILENISEETREFVPETLLAIDPFIFFSWILGDTYSLKEEDYCIKKVSQMHATFTKKKESAGLIEEEWESLEKILNTITGLPGVERSRVEILKRDLYLESCKIAKRQEELPYCIDSKDFIPRNIVWSEKGPVLVDLEKLQPTLEGEVLTYLENEIYQEEQFDRYISGFEEINCDHTEWFKSKRKFLKLRYRVLKLRVLTFIHSEDGYSRGKNYVEKLLKNL